MFTALTPTASILNMIRNKSSYERFESNLVSNKRASTQRLIEKFNLDKTNKKTQPSLIVEEPDVVVTSLVDDTTTAKTMEQVKVLNYSTLTKKLDHHHQRVSPIVHATSGVTSINSVKTLSPQIIKATTIPTAPTTENRQLQDDEYFNVYYNANDIKYPSYVINNASQQQQQIPRTRSRQSHQVNNLNVNGEATISSHSTFDFTTPLSSRKREAEETAATAAANLTLPLKNEHKIVTIMHRLPRKKSSSRRSAQSEVPTLFSEASTLTISEAKYPMINHLDDTSPSYHGPMSIQKIKKPDIFDMRAQNNLLVKSTSNLSSVSSNVSLIDFSKNENRLVNNKYHYYLNNNEQNNPLINPLVNHNHRVSHFDTKRTNLQYLSEDSLGSIKTTTSSIATQQPTFNSQKTHISMRPKRATTFFLTEELHPEEVLSNNNHNNRLPKRIDELSAENLKTNLEKISLKQIKTSLENNSSSINKSLNSILSKRNSYFRNDMLTQQQKAKLKAFQEKTTISQNVPHQNREIINKIYRAYNQNTKKFEGEPLDNLLNNDFKMPSINGAKNSAQNSTNNSTLTNENRRAEKQKEFLEKIESVKENINSMHSISNYNQLIQKYKQANLKEIDKNMSLNGENTMNKIDNLLNKKSDGFTGEVSVLPKKMNVPYSSNPNLDNENEDPAINEFSLTKSPLLDHNFSEKYPNGLHNRRSPMGSEENFNTRKKFFQNMVRESSISEDISLIPEINEQIDALSNSMQKKRVSFHENVIETDVESGNSIIKSIYN
jgi:hypothetical protein